MGDKVIGVLVAKDKEDYIDKVIDSIKGLVDVLVFVDDNSVDNTRYIVSRRCKKHKIKLLTVKSDKETPREELWELALEKARKKRKGDWWYFIVCPDTVVADAEGIRDLISKEHEEYKFKALKLAGDMKSGYIDGFTKPELRMFKSHLEMEITPAGFVVTDPKSNRNIDVNRFLGWNLSGLQYCDHIFQDYQRWLNWAWNAHHNQDMLLTEFICAYFNRVGTGEPSESYMKVFVLNRIRKACKKVGAVAQDVNMQPNDFEFKYMQLPKAIKDWECQFELVLDDDGDIIGRHPDLMTTSILDDSQIYQLANLEKYRGWLDE